MRSPRVRPRAGALIIAVAVAMAFVAYVAAANRPVAAGPVAAAPATAGAVAAAPVSARSVPAALPRLSLRQLAGQRVIYSYPGLTPPAGLLWLIRHGEAAGVIFFGSNISSRPQITAVIRQLDQADASPQNPVRAPLLLMTDQEGGVVRRLPGAPALSEKQIGQSAHPWTAATSAGAGAGRNLRGVGMNLNLAPVLDVFRTPGNFIDEFGRSYSMNPSTVARLGPAFINAQQRLGAAATAKHFPGLGAAARSQDTDAAPVTLNVSLSALRTIDELPYQAAIAAGVRLIMASWAVYPAIGSRRPAGLSSTMIQGELRKRLGFSGVTITDAIEAGALRAFGTIGNRSIQASKAGMDLMLCAGMRTSEGTQAVNALEGGYRDGSLNQTSFTAAAQRIVALRSSLGA